MSTLDPPSHHRRGRSKSPGRKREDDEPSSRSSRSKNRAPSPPPQTSSSKYAYDDEPTTRGKAYGYDDRERSGRDVADAQPRGYYDPRSSDPRVAAADPYYASQTQGGYAGGYPATSRAEYAAPMVPPKQEYSMPGAFDEEEAAPPLPARYPATTAAEASTTGLRGKVKDYYKDLAYGGEKREGREKKDYREDLAYGEKPYEKPEKKGYGREASPLPPVKKERSRYEDVSPPRKERSRYEDVSPPPRKGVSKYQDSESSEEEAPRKGAARYEDVSPPPRASRYEDEDPRRSKTKFEDEDPRRSKTKFVDDGPRTSRSKYEDPSPKSSQYQELDRYKYERDRADPKEYEAARRYEEKYEEKYGKPVARYEQEDKYGKPADRYEEKDKYGKPVDKYESDGRDRGASFNIAAGQHSFSGGVNISSRPTENSQYARPPSPSGFAPPGALGNPSGYADLKQYQYAQTDSTAPTSYTKSGDITGKIYNARPASPPYSANPYSADPRSRTNYQPDSARSSSSKIVTVDPDTRGQLGAMPGAYRRDPSPAPGLNRGLHSLSVSTGHHGGASLSLATAPGSPLLESYHGTYQSISPMPSPLMIAQTAHSDALVLQALEPDSSSDEDDRRGKKKRNARFHDPVEEAATLAQALKGDRRGPDIEPLIEILPALSHDQILDLRVEYKKIVKTGPERKGVNIAKHIKSRMKEEDDSLRKACYACALGKWESEAYWANFWYQGEKSRRELLIESLMGRTNREIQEIKDGFSDKKYGDSLTKCMKTELREDKFKKAVLLVLDEKKMEERPGYALDRDLIDDDVKNLYRAVRAEKGGETAMINIVVVRSDAHLREVLRIYEATYRANFAREMLKKSGNLVGELLAHILNGVINKPVRDALLVHHALSLSRSDSIRTELLISRLVRYHWDRPHMEAVKREYRTRYGVDMQKAVAEGTRGKEWGHFCEMLCVRRMENEVRRVSEYDRVDRR